MSNNELLSLAERVEKGSGSDHGTNREVCRAIHGADYQSGTDERGMPWLRIPDFTGSLDAAVTLIEERLPGRKWELRYVSEVKQWRAQFEEPYPYGLADESPVRALLSAALRALTTQEPTP